MKVFISHTPEDMALARKVAVHLKASGFDVWDDTKILPGENWAENIAQALRECEAMVVLLTPDALASRWVEAEISYALGQSSYGHRLIPVFVGSPDEIPEEKIPWILRRLKGVVLGGPGKNEEGIAQIALALKQVA